MKRWSSGGSGKKHEDSCGKRAAKALPSLSALWTNGGSRAAIFATATAISMMASGNVFALGFSTALGICGCSMEPPRRSRACPNRFHPARNRTWSTTGGRQIGIGEGQVSSQIGGTLTGRMRCKSGNH
ncbi:unnamed protein product [Periconia digitata]|uniref:Uncharacterized protein n=1 Tax=Periconia digitata TaxID=1303443 RepID=A0A9W4XUW7_9PLEO|nr:unnamed protein product [Periconia digitata]